MKGHALELMCSMDEVASLTLCKGGAEGPDAEVDYSSGGNNESRFGICCHWTVVEDLTDHRTLSVSLV